MFGTVGAFRAKEGCRWLPCVCGVGVVQLVMLDCTLGLDLVPFGCLGGKGGLRSPASCLLASITSLDVPGGLGRTYAGCCVTVLDRELKC